MKKKIDEERAGKLRLRAYRPEDCTVIINWIKDERTHALWCANRFPFPMDEASFERCRTEGEKQWGGSSFTAVTSKEEPMGYFNMSIDPHKKSAFLCFFIVNDQVRGRGYGTEILRLIKEYTFSIAGVERIELRVFDVNEAAVRCYQKAGFVVVECESEAFCFQKEKWGRVAMEIAALSGERG